MHCLYIVYLRPVLISMSEAQVIVQMKVRDYLFPTMPRALSFSISKYCNSLLFNLAPRLSAWSQIDFLVLVNVAKKCQSKGLNVNNCYVKCENEIPSCGFNFNEYYTGMHYYFDTSRSILQHTQYTFSTFYSSESQQLGRNLVWIRKLRCK